MKRNIRIGLIGAMLSFVQLSFADYTFYSGDSDFCDTLPGQWSGSGQAYNRWIGTCVYHGSGLIEPLDNVGNFTIDTSANKESGSFLCPSHAAKKLTGTCINGVLIIKTEFGNLTGSVTGNNGEAKGILTVSPGITADVAAKFSRAG